ncbi:MAG: VOC family protein [Anaerolineales bacterium]|nr:VOC family protein [Chloroflexota bacterium]MBL6980111.1 VOC family protein [Anaerolineales bacterium]
MLKEFYVEHFSASANEKYERPDSSFASYFLTFPEGGQIEIMQAPDVSTRPYDRHDRVVGLTHMTIAVPTRSDVDAMFQRLKDIGCAIEKAPRQTGDGFYECAVIDPDGNIIEIVSET